MKGFVYTVIFATLVLWTIIFRTFNNIAPDSVKNIAYVLLLLFAAISFTLSLPRYFLSLRHSIEIINNKKLYRGSLRRAALESLLICGFLALRAFGIATFINTVLYLILCAMILLQKDKKR